MDTHIRDPVTVQLYAMANGRKSEYHNFVYTPKADRYSAIPSYSLQSHVAEGNYCSTGVGRRGSPGVLYTRGGDDCWRPTKHFESLDEDELSGQTRPDAVALSPRAMSVSLAFLSIDVLLLATDDLVPD